ncbi:amidohydrolase [Geoanaerobacter pelophilus]|uniref:Amidohydrolase n=1 Tax=Geoanaerobacter pelophilus TaxID=60036 RepID=A0ABQ0MEQ4_9BACT|nr:amidohydrolase family protein [Geoanaerobacter pelophilus]GAW65399.1 amidohydrolase [Geoanaerobacter pelophilus]
MKLLTLPGVEQGSAPAQAAGFIDVHLHCFTGSAWAQQVLEQSAELRRQGFSHVVAIGMVNTRLSYDEVRTLIPGWVENRGNPQYHELDELLEHARRSEGFIIPLVDTRYLWGDVASTLGGYLEQGVRGIKGIWLTDNNDIGVKGVPETFGITLEEYRRREWEIFSYAQENDLPLLYHMDAREHADTMAAMMQDFPRVRVNFPHFGIGRKPFSKILDDHPGVYTDMANLISHLRKNPESYRDFIIHYQDQVCLGSDAFLYDMGSIVQYLEALRGLGLPEEVLHKVCSVNPRAFLGKALP